MNEIDKQEVVYKKVDAVLANIDEVIPSSWTKSQVASVLSVYLEIYK